MLGQVVQIGNTICEMPALRAVHREPAPQGPAGHILVKFAPATGEPAVLWAMLEGDEPVQDKHGDA